MTCLTNPTTFNGSVLRLDITLQTSPDATRCDSTVRKPSTASGYGYTGATTDTTRHD